MNFQKEIVEAFHRGEMTWFKPDAVAVWPDVTSWGMTLADIARLPDSFFVEIDGDRLQANIYQHAPNGQIQYVYSYPLI